MKQPISIGHQLHPARQQGKSLVQGYAINWCLATNKSLAIGTANVDALYNKLTFEYPDVKMSKHNVYVLIEKQE